MLFVGLTRWSARLARDKSERRPTFELIFIHIITAPLVFLLISSTLLPTPLAISWSHQPAKLARGGLSPCRSLLRNPFFSALSLSTLRTSLHFVKLDSYFSSHSALFFNHFWMAPPPCTWPICSRRSGSSAGTSAIGSKGWIRPCVETRSATMVLEPNIGSTPLTVTMPVAGVDASARKLAVSSSSSEDASDSRSARSTSSAFA